MANTAPEGPGPAHWLGLMTFHPLGSAAEETRGAFADCLIKPDSISLRKVRNCDNLEVEAAKVEVLDLSSSKGVRGHYQLHNVGIILTLKGWKVGLIYFNEGTNGSEINSERLNVF